MFAGDTGFPSLCLQEIQSFLLYFCGIYRLSFITFAGDTGFPSLRLREIQAFLLYVCGRYRLSFSMIVRDTGMSTLWLWEIQACPPYDCGRYRHTIRMFVEDVPSFLTIIAYNSIILLSNDKFMRGGKYLVMIVHWSCQ